MPLTARYATTCGVCGGQISPGEEITDTGAVASRRWAHVNCPPGLFDVASDSQPPIPEPVDAHLHLRQWIVGMSIEACRYEHEIRLEHTN